MKTHLLFTLMFIFAMAFLVIWAANAQESQPLQEPPQAEQNVELVGQIGGTTEAVAVQGNYAYIGLGPRLVILDVSTPASPSLAGQTGILPAVVRGLAVAGNYAYVAADDQGLRIIDVADPAHPTGVGFMTRRGPPMTYRWQGITPTLPMGMAACTSSTSPIRRTRSKPVSIPPGRPLTWQ